MKRILVFLLRSFCLAALMVYSNRLYLVASDHGLWLDSGGEFIKMHRRLP